jgi:inner membrane protein
VDAGRLPPVNGPSHPGDRALLGTWMALMVLALFTHPLLDVFTTYGTQLLAPFSYRRFAIDAVAIVDPLYSAVLAAALVVGASRASPRTARRAATAALAVTTGYLFYGVRLNAQAESVVARRLAAEGVSAAAIRCYPTLLQPWLRRAVVRLPGEVRVGMLSLWQPGPVEWRRFTPPEHALVDQVRETEEGRLFEWFAMGETAGRVRPVPGGHVVEIEDLRYGLWGPPDQGIWGIRATFDAQGRLEGGIERFNRRPEGGVGSLVQRIWKATFSPEVEPERSGPA